MGFIAAAIDDMFAKVLFQFVLSRYYLLVTISFKDEGKDEKKSLGFGGIDASVTDIAKGRGFKTCLPDGNPCPPYGSPGMSVCLKGTAVETCSPIIFSFPRKLL